MNWPLIWDIASGFFLIVGCAQTLLAAIGALRFPDLLARVHAATKPQVLGLICIVLGVALHLRTWPIWTALILVVLFQLITAPVSAHMLGRGGFRTSKVRRTTLVRDELTEEMKATRRAARQRAVAKELGRDWSDS